MYRVGPTLVQRDLIKSTTTVPSNYSFLKETLFSLISVIAFKNLFNNLF